MSVAPRSDLKAVILAAGNGHRLVTPGMGIPKPLCRVGGKPLLDRVLSGFTAAGIHRFVLVLGYLRSKIEEHVATHWSAVEMETVFNPDFNEGNGLSVLAARPRVEGSFVIGMADHIFETEALSGLLDEGPEPEGITLAIDRKLGSVFDLPEATKVRLLGTRVLEVGKQLKTFDAVDTGLFYAGPELLDSLEASRREGRTTLSDGVNVLAAERRVRAVDVGASRWMDVDTPEELREAERILVEARSR